MGKFGFSFSAKRALGITKMRSQIARTTGIPTTRAGRKRKLQTALLGALFTPSRPQKERVVYVQVPATAPNPRPTDGGFFGAVKRLIGFAVLLVALLVGVGAYSLYSTNKATAADRSYMPVAIVAGVLGIWGLSWAKRPKPRE